MRPAVLGAVLVLWLAITAAALWTLNPLGAPDLAEVCAGTRADPPR